MTQKIRIYTKTGDKGETGLYGGKRVKKTDQRIMAIGTVDELNSLLGVAATQSSFSELLEQIQNELFNIGAELANPEKVMETFNLTEEKINFLEKQIDSVDKGLEPIRNFILPGGTYAASLLHHARTVCRRAEREIIKLNETTTVNPNLVKYLNRLSDLLFTLGRAENHGKKTEKNWRKS